jgi:LPS-assembly lipoprotein
MWSGDLRAPANRLLRLAAAMTLAALTAACFQPLYGERSPTGGSALREALAAIDVDQIAAPNGTPLARIAVETRNELLFDLTGGGGRAAPTHKLTVRLVSSKSSIILDPTTLRSEFENFGLDANYTLTEIVSGKTAVTGSAITRVTYNTPGQQQRFVRERGLRDAETRAAKEIAEQIRTRLASYFVAGT